MLGISVSVGVLFVKNPKKPFNSLSISFNNMKKMQPVFKFLFVFVVFAIAYSVSAVAIDDSITPQNCDRSNPACAQFVDTTSIGQIKWGGFIAGGLRSLTNLFVDGKLGVGTLRPSTGEKVLKVDVEGAVGAQFYCDENGNHCVSAPFGGNGGNISLTTTGGGLIFSPTTITNTGVISLDTTFIQKRVDGLCTGSQAIKQINQDGTVICQATGGSTGDSFWGGTLTGNIRNSNTGNVGIGKNPDTEFDVNGNIRGTYFYAAGAATGEGGGYGLKSLFGSNWATNQAGMYLGGDGTGTSPKTLVLTNMGNNSIQVGSNGRISMGLGFTGVDPEKMTSGVLNVNGKVILNDLTLNTPSKGNGKVLTSDSNGNADWQTLSSASSGPWVTNDLNIYNSNIGNVGIGKNPDTKFDVDGNIRGTYFYAAGAATGEGGGYGLRPLGPGSNWATNQAGMYLGDNSPAGTSPKTLVLTNMGNNSIQVGSNGRISMGLGFTGVDPEKMTSGVLNVNGKVILNDLTLNTPSKGNGKVLTSDSNGNADWQAPAASAQCAVCISAYDHGSNTWSVWSCSGANGAESVGTGFSGSSIEKVKVKMQCN